MGPGPSLVTANIYFETLRPLLRLGSLPIDWDRSVCPGVPILVFGAFAIYSCVLTNQLTLFDYLYRFSACKTFRKRCYRPIFHPALFSAHAAIPASTAFKTAICAPCRSPDRHTDTPCPIFFFFSGLDRLLHGNTRPRPSQLHLHSNPRYRAQKSHLYQVYCNHRSPPQFHTKLLSRSLGIFHPFPILSPPPSNVSTATFRRNIATHTHTNPLY